MSLILAPPTIWLTPSAMKPSCFVGSPLYNFVGNKPSNSSWRVQFQNSFVFVICPARNKIQVRPNPLYYQGHSQQEHFQCSQNILWPNSFTRWYSLRICYPFVKLPFLSKFMPSLVSSIYLWSRYSFVTFGHLSSIIISNFFACEQAPPGGMG